MFRYAALFVLFLAAPAFAADHKPGEPFRDCDVCPDVVAVPAGTFTMGKEGGYKYEVPAHKVTIAKPFAIGVTEVTFDQWQACFDDGGCGDKMPDDHKWGTGTRPVINITYARAVDYVNWLSKKTGHTYRLPSEAEWEYAARAGTTTDYFWGDDPGKNLANCRDCASQWSAKGSAPVASFKPNPWGLYDMHGNEWEWTTDCWNPTYDGAPTDGSAWTTGDCTKRPMRSGSWYYFHRNVRSSWRWPIRAVDVSYNFTLRVIRELP